MHSDPFLKNFPVLGNKSSVLALAAFAMLGGSAKLTADPLQLTPTLTPEEREYYDFLGNSTTEFISTQLKAPPDRADGNTLHPKFQYHLEKYPRAPGPHPTLGEQVVTPEQRVEYRWLTDRVWNKRTYETREMKRVDERYIMGSGGALRTRTYIPYTDDAPGTPLPILLYFHGGGWLTGSIVAVDPAVRLIANEAQAIVVSADYRLSPEHTYPAAHDDAMAVYRWVREHARELGGDPARIGVGGDSAGGHMALVTGMRAQAEKVQAPAYLLLYYPVVDIDTENYRSFKEFGTGFGLNADAMGYFRKTYFPNEQDRKSPFASPMRASSFRGMPPTIVITPGFDLLRDQGATLAERMKKDGVKVTYLNYGSLIHGFMQHTKAVDAALAACIESARVFGAAIRTAN